MHCADRARRLLPVSRTLWRCGVMAKYGSKAKKSVAKSMHEFKRGKLKSGGKSRKKVSNPKQAIAIGLSKARKKGAKVPKKAKSK